MSRPRRSAIRWVRIVHRWIAMAFVVVVTPVILPILPPGPAYDTVGISAIVLLFSLAISGLWMGVHHYIVKFRHAPRRSAVPVATGQSH